MERDLGTHLETALKGAIIPDRWPKSGLEIAVMVLEGEDDAETRQGTKGGVEGVGLMNVLAACITVAAAALADARIDCLDLVSGGVAAIVPGSDGKMVRILDPSPVEHDDLVAACVVGYLPSRDEITEIWARGGLSSQEAGFDELIDGAVAAARGTHMVLQEVVKESTNTRARADGLKEKLSARNDAMNDVEMIT